MSAFMFFKYAFAGVLGAGIAVCLVGILAWVINKLIDN